MLHLPFYNLLHGHGETTEPSTLTSTEELVNTVVTIVGRLMFSSIFLAGGINHLTQYQGMVDYATANHVPWAGLLVPMTGLMILVGGAAMLFGWYARLGAWLIALFLVPTAFMMHHFWDITDSQMSAIQMAHFMKNISLAGAALLFTRFGGGVGSVNRE